MKIPESVKILGMTYKIEQVECIDRDFETVGQADHNQLIIKLQSGLPEDQIGNTLIHEIVHSIFEILGEHESNENEPYVKRISSALYQVINDNKSLFLG